MCLKDDAYTDYYTAFATGELRATPPTVLCSVPLKHIIQENGKICGFRFHFYLCRYRTGMVITMKITIVQKSTEASQDRDDFTLWQVAISQEDYDALIEKYQNGGYSVRGNKDQIIEEFIQVI